MKRKITISTSNEVKHHKLVNLFLRITSVAFGKLVTDCVREELKDLPMEKQSLLASHILYYLHSDAIVPTGDPDIDIRITEIIEILPDLNVTFVQSIFKKHLKTFPKTFETYAYRN